ncbi:MAG: oxidoreductase [Candidatus Xenobia bacterium]
MIGWGIIGCGAVAETKSGPAFSRLPGSRLVAVMRRDGALAADFARRHGALRSYSSAQELLADPEVSAVYVATPPDSHARYAILAMQAGKPVYVEKPMALNALEAEQMLEVSRATGQPLFVAYYRRCLPAFLKVREWLSRIGEVRFVLCELVRGPDPEGPDAWRVQPELSGGGYFVDLGSHVLDLLDFLLGPITRARGTPAWQAGMYPAEDLVTAELVFSNGALGTGVWCFNARPEDQRDRVEIVGSRARLSFSCFRPDPVRLSTGEEFVAESVTCVQEPLLATVLSALRGEGECPSTGHSALRTERVMDAILGRSPSSRAWS